MQVNGINVCMWGLVVKVYISGLVVKGCRSRLAVKEVNWLMNACAKGLVQVEWL